MKYILSGRDLDIVGGENDEVDELRKLVYNFMYQTPKTIDLGMSVLVSLTLRKIKFDTLKKISQACLVNEGDLKLREFGRRISVYLFGVIVTKFSDQLNNIEFPHLENWTNFVYKLKSRGLLIEEPKPQPNRDRIPKLEEIDKIKPARRKQLGKKYPKDVEENMRGDKKLQEAYYSNDISENDLNMFQILKDEIRRIRSFLGDKMELESCLDKAYFWIWFCYKFRLYSEGSLLIRRINFEKVPIDLKNTLRKIGEIFEEKSRGDLDIT